MKKSMNAFHNSRLSEPSLFSSEKSEIGGNISSDTLTTIEHFAAEKVKVQIERGF